MRKFLKWFMIVVGGLVALVVVLVLVLAGITNSRLNKTYDVSVDPVTIPTDAESVGRGLYLATALSPCIGCHGDDLAGTFLVDDPSIGQIYSANLTAGQGGKGAIYTDQDWVRALRYGLDPDGKPLLVMPSQHYRYLSDQDLGSLIAYIKSIPPVDQESPEAQLTAMAKVLFALGMFGQLPADIIADADPAPEAPAQGVTVEYGEYIGRVAGCRDCHGDDLAGGTLPGGNEATPDITQGGQLLVWTEADFIQAFRTGETPQGELDQELMPIAEYQMKDDDLRALFLYLQSLPAVHPEQ